MRTIRTKTTTKTTGKPRKIIDRPKVVAVRLTTKEKKALELLAEKSFSGNVSDLIRSFAK